MGELLVSGRVVGDFVTDWHHGFKSPIFNHHHLGNYVCHFFQASISKSTLFCMILEYP